MIRRRILSVLGVGTALFCILAGRASATDAGIPVVDFAEGLVARTVDGPDPLTSTTGQAAARRLRQGNVIGVVIPLHEPRLGARLDRPAESAFRDLDRWFSLVTDFHPQGCRDVEPIRTWLSLDDVSTIAQDSGGIELWVTRGVRILGLVQETDNDLATSYTDPLPGPLVGLSARGAAVVRRIYAAGGIVDIASGSSMTRQDVFALTSKLHVPVVALSANARALADHPRNLTDVELRAVGASGGVVAISLDSHQIIRGRAATLHDLVRQILYLTRVAGVEHVAIGSGYEVVRPPDGLDTAADFPVIARALLGAGMNRGDVERIFSGNALRLLCASR